MPDTTQRNSKECCIWTCSHVHAGKAMTISENNGKCRWYLQSKNRQIRWQKDKELSGGVFLQKKKNNFYFSWKVTQSRYKYYFCVEFLDGGKWKKHFPVLFSENMPQLMNFMGLLIFPFKWGGQIFPSSAIWKSRSCYTWELKRQQARDMWLQISSPVAVSLLWTVR